MENIKCKRQACLEFIPKKRAKRGAFYCSNDCQRIEYHGINARGRGSNRNTTGATSELIVATDLIREGFAVYRALSSSAPCDLIIINGENKVCRIEVKTATRSRHTGKVSFGLAVRQKPLHDILALCFLDENNVVEYRPPLSEWFKSKDEQSS